MPLLTPSRVTPHRGCTAADGLGKRTCQPLGTLDSGTIQPASLGGHRDLLGHGPHPRDQRTGHRHHHCDAGFSPVRAVVDRGCTGGPVPSTAGPGAAGGVFPGGGAGADSRWPDRARPTPLSTRARRAGVFPVCGLPPWGRRSPRASSDGVRPPYGMRCLGFSTRGRSPRAATVVTATGHCTPRRAWSAATSGPSRQAVTGAWRSWASRWSRSGGSVTARTSAGQTRGGAGGARRPRCARAGAPGPRWPARSSG